MRMSPEEVNAVAETRNGIWHDTGMGGVERSRQQTRPRSLTWAFAMERVTGIEPAL